MKLLNKVTAEELSRIIQRRIEDFSAYSLCSTKSTGRRNLAFETVQPYETFRMAQHRSHIFLLREVIEEWKNLHPEAEQEVIKKEGVKRARG